MNINPRKREYSEEVVQFIDNVKFKPYLYDKSAPDYKNELQKSKGWIEISRAMNRKGNDKAMEKWAYDKWRKLKLTYGQYRRKLRRIAPDGKDYLSNRDKCPWPYFNIMTFFDDYIPIRKQVQIFAIHVQNAYATQSFCITTKNLLNRSPSVANVSNDTNDFDDSVSIMTDTDAASIYSRVSSIQSPSRGDSLYHFGQFITEELRTLPMQQRLSLQKEIIHLLFEVKYEVENMS